MTGSENRSQQNNNLDRLERENQGLKEENQRLKSGISADRITAIALQLIRTAGWVAIVGITGWVLIHYAGKVSTADMNFQGSLSLITPKDCHNCPLPWWVWGTLAFFGSN